MKYNILVKYVNSFPSAYNGESISYERLSILCDALGRVHVGDGYINIFGGAYAHASACALESVLCAAGYSVCRITDIYEYDVRECVFINGKQPSMDDYIRVITHIRSIIKKHSYAKFLREEVAFAFSLYMAKLMGAKYIILENTTAVGEAICEICPSFSYAIIPKVYDDVSEGNLKKKGAIIDKVTRGVVTGNNNFYGFFSDKCQKSGIRLSIHRSFEVLQESNRSCIISQGNREYSLNSSSEILRDGVVSVIELVEILKIHGAKIPPAKITEGINSLSSCGLMNIISSSPIVISDISSSSSELRLLAKRIDEIQKKGNIENINLFIHESSLYALKLLEEYLKDTRLTLGAVLSSAQIDDYRCVKSYKELAAVMLEKGKLSESAIVVGKCEFIQNVKIAFRNVMNKI